MQPNNENPELLILEKQPNLEILDLLRLETTEHWKVGVAKGSKKVDADNHNRKYDSKNIIEK
jgi:hypothetical protein